MASTPQQAVQADWENREFAETVATGIKRIAEFLNNFGELPISLSLPHAPTHSPPPFPCV